MLDSIVRKVADVRQDHRLRILTAFTLLHVQWHHIPINGSSRVV